MVIKQLIIACQQGDRQSLLFCVCISAFQGFVFCKLPDAALTLAPHLKSYLILCVYLQYNV